MKINRNMMSQAVEARIISEEQSQELLNFFKKCPNQGPQFTLTNVLYYFGGLIAIGAMTLFMGLSWELYGKSAVFLLSLSYSIIGLALAHVFRNKGHDIPAGICATFTVCLTPLTVYAVQNMLGIWPEDANYSQFHYCIKWNWMYMELSTLIVGIVFAWLYRYPFMTMPIAATLWYMSMDLTSMINGYYDFELSPMISMYFGLITTLIAFWVDVRSAPSKDYAFWLYIFGVMAFWGGLSSQSSDSELSKFIYLGINLIMIFIGVLLNRKVFVLFGAIGCCSYLGHLAYQVFEFSYLFPVALTLIGIGIIYLGVLWQNNEATLTYKLRSFLPRPLRALLEARDE